jgi:CMP/dCMP kinase
MFAASQMRADKEPSMPVVTISRQFGAGGSSVAEIVARDLKAEVVDKKLIEEVARRLDVSTADVEAETERPDRLLERLVRSFATLEPAMGAGWTPPFPDPWFDPRKAIVQLTQQVIREVADSGNVVIVGRGAGFLLKDRPDVFRVFLRAPEDVRIGVLMGRFRWDEGEARRRMHETDANRAAYTRQLYKHDWCDPDGYDLIVNTGRLTYRTAAEIILRGVRQPVVAPV